jgi:hypothetical protein
MPMYRPMFPKTRSRRRFNCSQHLLLTALFAFFLAGCQTAMSAQSLSSDVTATNAWPLQFKRHGFDAFCYNTQACTVIYSDLDLTPEDKQRPSGAPPAGDYRAKWGKASHIGINNFPGPAVVKWTSADGQAHEARVDIAEIFKDERVLHQVKQADYPEGSFGGSVDIFLEVNDRTLTVFSKAHVPTKTEQVPGNKYSFHRNDLIQAWSKTY